MMTKEEIERIVANVTFLDRTFLLMPKGDGFLLQLSYREEDVVTHEMAEQKSRKHYISPHMTETEIVETALLCAERSMMHVVHEHFAYKGRLVHSPHFAIEGRLRLVDEGCFDRRPEK